MRRFRTGLITVVLVAVFSGDAVIAFCVLDERRDLVALTAGVVVDHVTCLAPEVLVAAVPEEMQSPEPLSEPLPLAGTVPDNFESASVVVC